MLPASPLHGQVRVVLVEPMGPLNIGSVARAMLNFGVDRLRLVAPKAAHYNADARRMAVKGKTILKAAELYPDLASALADCHFAYATTRRLGKYRKNTLHPVQAAKQAVPLLAGGPVALVFGREDHGLFTSEIDLCQRLITIPVHDEMPSLNLAQAVGLCLYELHQAITFPDRAGLTPKQLAPGAQREHMLAHMQQTLGKIGFLDRKNPEHIMRAFRQILGRAALDEREVRVLEGLWSQIDWIHAQAEKITSQSADG